MKFRFKRNKKETKSLEKELKEYKLGFYIVFVFFLFASGLFFWQCISFFLSGEEIIYDTKITYHNLTEDQIEYIEITLSEIKPYLLERTKSLDFYQYGKLPKSFFYSESQVGFNRHRHISLEFEPRFFKEGLCHELLHNWVHEELPVYDLSKIDEVCYKSKDWVRPELSL